MSYIQKNWGNAVIATIVDQLPSKCTKNIDKARILAARSPHAGDWLNTLLLSSIGLQMFECQMKQLESPLVCAWDHSYVSRIFVFVLVREPQAVCMVWPAEVLEDNGDIKHSMTSFGAH